MAAVGKRLRVMFDDSGRATIIVDELIDTTRLKSAKPTSTSSQVWAAIAIKSRPRLPHPIKRVRSTRAGPLQQRRTLYLVATAIKTRGRRYLLTKPTLENDYRAPAWSRHVAQIGHDGRQLGRTIPERPARDRLTFVPTPAPPPPAKGWGREFNPEKVAELYSNSATAISSTCSCLPATTLPAYACNRWYLRVHLPPPQAG